MTGRKVIVGILLFCSCTQHVFADNEYATEADTTVTNSFWDNWYGQFGVNMNLQFPYGGKMADVFPNGKSFGINAAVGKWFTPEFGGRFKLTWGNGIFKNEHNQWLNPYGVPGENQRTGGYISFLGDILFNLHNLIVDYNPDRKWNLIIAPRAGGWFNIGSSEGAPVLGIAITNTYRLSDRWRLYADVGYHFISSVNGPQSEGHGANSFADINVGVEFDLSKNNKFHKTQDRVNHSEKSIAMNGLWDNWFAQAGIGMALFNAYRTNFEDVFPNGSSYGVNLGIGKWFSPEAGLRVGLNWQNGLIINHSATYLYPEDKPESECKKHGIFALYADFFFNLHNAISGYDEHRKWCAIIFPRMGLVNNLSIEKDEECPVLGIGTEQTFKLNDRVKLYADVAYQVATGGIVNGNHHTDNTGSNGWFDLNVGLQYEIGKYWWDKPGGQRAKDSQLMVHGGHNWPRFIVNTGASVVVAFGAKTALKAMVKEDRPDHSDNKSFPSGHAAIAFAAARSIDKEFRKDCIWIPIAGYAAATAIGIERVASDRHHWYDVAAGAALGFGSAELTWWLSDIIFKKHNEKYAVGFSGNTLDVAVNF